MASKGDVHIFSTLTSAVNYRTYEPGGGDLPVVVSSIRIEGGSNIPDKHLVTPIGVVTTVTQAQLEELMTNPVFRKHLENGFLAVKVKEYEPEVVVADMETRDKSAPLVEQDFEADTKAAEQAGLTGTATPKRSSRKA